MATPYEIEHGVQANETGTRDHRDQHGRRVDMTSFFSFLSQISPASDPPTTNPSQQHHNPHAEATPVDTANLLRLLQDQYGTLLATAEDEGNEEFLRLLIERVDESIQGGGEGGAGLPEIRGVSQEWLDGLDRVERRDLKARTLKAKWGKVGKTVEPKEEKCPICAEKFVDDENPLVVELPCGHWFDLECISPWLRSMGSCPMCRRDYVKKKEVVVVDSEDEEEFESMYA